MLITPSRVMGRILPKAAKRKLRQWLEARRQERYQPRRVRRRYGDAILNIELVDEKGERWYDWDRAFDPEITLLAEHGLRPGVRVFDLGAHQGIIALCLAHLDY